MMSRGRNEREVETSLAFKVQIVILAIIATALGAAGFIIPWLLFSTTDPIISLIFAALLGVVSAFLGGTVVYGWFTVRTNVKAREMAQEMVDKALGGDLEEMARQQRDYYEGLYDKEREHLVSQLDGEKKKVEERLRREYEGKLRGEEDAYAEEMRLKFERRLEDEKQALMDHVNADFQRQLEDERKAYDERIETLLQEKERSVESLIRDKDERIGSLLKEKDELSRTLREEKDELSRTLREDFDKRIEEEKKAYSEIVRKDFEQWKKEFADDFKRELARDIKPAEPGQLEQILEEAKKPSPAPSAKVMEEALTYRPASTPDREVKEYNFFSMSSEEKVSSAVGFLQDPNNRGTGLVFFNTKDRRSFRLKSRGRNEVVFECALEMVSIRARIKIREFCAQNKLPMDKNDDLIRIAFGSDTTVVRMNLREAMETAFGSSLDNLNFDVKLEAA